MRAPNRSIVLGLLVAMFIFAAPPALSSDGELRPVPFKPIMTPVTTNLAKKYVVRKHTLVIVPLYKATLPNEQAMRSMGSRAKEFWEREIPGMRIAIRYLPPTRMASACDRNVTKAWNAAPRIARINARATGNHVLAYAPECHMSGLGDFRAGFGVMYIGKEDPEGAMLAHEFGHNLGLLHANALECRAGGQIISLARSCTESEYGNWSGVMGNGPSLEDGVRVGPIAQVAMTGRVVSIPSSGARTITLSATSKGMQAAVLRSRFGAIYLGANHARPSLYGFYNSQGSIDVQPTLSHLQAQVHTAAGSGRLRFPEVASITLPEPDGLELGCAWDVPGTNRRVVVVGADRDSVTIRVTTRTHTIAVPSTPVLSMPPDGTFPDRAPWLLEWSTPAADAGAFIVTSQGEILARVDGSARSAIIPARSVPWTGDDTMPSFRVIAVGASGGVSESAPITVAPVNPALSFSPSTTESDPAVISAPVTLSWVITPAVYSGFVKSWTIDYAGTKIELPAAQTSITIDPASARDPDDTYVRVTGTDVDGKVLIKDYFVFTISAR